MGKGEGFTCTNCGARNFWNPQGFIVNTPMPMFRMKALRSGGYKGKR